MTTAIIAAQGPGIADRSKACARASTTKRRRDLTNDGACLRVAALPVGRAKRPGERHRVNLGVRHDTTPASINSSVKGKDASFALI